MGKFSEQTIKLFIKTKFNQSAFRRSGWRHILSVKESFPLHIRNLRKNTNTSCSLYMYMHKWGDSGGKL